MNETFTPILARYGIGRWEFYVLNAIDIRGSEIAIDKLASFVHGLSLEDEYSVEDLRETVETCLSKQWIKVLTQQDCVEDRLRWQGADDQCCGESEYQAGNVDFTPEGAFLYDAICREMDALKGKQPYQSTIHYSWKTPGRLRIYAIYPEDLRKVIDRILSGTDTHPLSHGEQISHVEEPHRIQGWWLNRFVQLPQAYYCDAYYSEE
jgi:hypothetical protein